MLGAMGITLMAGALTVPHGIIEAVFTMAGVAAVAGAHFLNRRAHAFR
jgi:hypothetical protein